VNGFTLVRRGLAFRWRTNLAVALGAALATAVLVGSLGAGDTVRYSLRRITETRLGRTVYALEGGERFFRKALADELAERLGGRAAAVIVLPGAVSVRGGETRVSGLQVVGADPAFWLLAPEAPMGAAFREAIAPDQVLLNEPLAQRLAVTAGEELLLRVQSPSPMPGEAPLAVGGDTGAALRLTVAGVVPEGSFGSFSLRVSQVAPLTAFVSREALARRLDRPDRANTLLLAPSPGSTLAEAQAALGESWTLDDAGLSLLPLDGGWELTSERVFLEPAAAEAALAAGGHGVLTYFVDTLSSSSGSLSYSFVSAPGPGRLGPAEPGDGEIVLNSWAARELGVAPGDPVELGYRVPGPGEGLETGRERLRVSAVVPIEPEDRGLMPRFPGLAGAESCRDWDPGYPIDLSLIRDRDEAYWDAYRGSPRGFVSLATARRLWANRFGSLTAVRFPAPGSAGTGADLAGEIREQLPPASLGLRLSPAREIGLEASAGGVDFGTLFLGLSFFLVAASLLLTALLFLLSVEERRGDVGTLAALGFTPGRIRGILLGEGALVAAAGGLLGLPLGLAFHRGVLVGLRGAWQDVIRTSVIRPYVSPASLALGLLAGVAASLVVIALATRRALLRPPARGLRQRRAHAGAHGSTPWLVASALGVAAGAGACLLALSPPLSFFAAGALLLVAWLTGTWLLLRRLARPRARGLPSVARLGLENAARRRSRSLAVAALLASGVFVVTAVAANRRQPAPATDPASGTGGFALIAETAIPLVRDLAARSARQEYGLTSPPLEEVRFVGFRTLEGDDASCLNLNRVGQPRILAVEPRRLAGRFSFARFAGPRPDGDPWLLLEQDLGPGIVPGIADETVITWGLGMSVGDELEYRSERGESLKVRLVAGLANSVFQGNLIVAEAALLRHFPSASGRSFFLIDVPEGRDAAEVETAINRSLSRFGVSLIAAADRLAEFDSVQDTYLAIFGLLGWLGMLIGTLGLGVVVVRNVAQSRSELALLRAVGLPRGSLLRIVLAEYLPPLGLGLAGGAAASALAVIPAAAQGIPLGLLAAMFAAVLACSVACTVTAAAVSLRAELLPALRNE